METNRRALYRAVGRRRLLVVVAVAYLWGFLCAKCFGQVIGGGGDGTTGWDQDVNPTMQARLLTKLDDRNTKAAAVDAALADLNEWQAVMVACACASGGWYLVGRLGRGSALWGVRGERP